MNTYKIGNKIKCILRAFNPGPIGKYNMEYGNQPYTVLKDIDAELTYDLINKDATQNQALLSYNIEHLDKIKISNIKLTDKILNLIYLKSEEFLCSTNDFYRSNNNNEIFLSLPTDGKIYQVFIYDNTGSLEAAYGELDVNKIQVLKANAEYNIFYSYVSSQGYLLDRSNNTYLTLDLEVLGNTNNQTEKFFIHLDKCALIVQQDLFFSDDINTIDLEFKILKSSNPNYITVR